MKIRSQHANDRSWVDSLVSEHFGSSRVVSRGILHDALSLPGLVAERDGVPVGLLLYRMERDECEIVVLIAGVRREGIGHALLGAIEPIARRAGCRRLWLITTNNNRSGLAFYRAVGWKQVAVHRRAVQEARWLKPEIPEFDEDGTPIEDEIEFELNLEGASQLDAADLDRSGPISSKSSCIQTMWSTMPSTFEVLRWQGTIDGALRGFLRIDEILSKSDPGNHGPELSPSSADSPNSKWIALLQKLEKEAHTLTFEQARTLS